MWVGIDPSLTGTAIAIIREDEFARSQRFTVDTFRCPTTGHATDTHEDTRLRHNRIERWLRDRLEELGRIDLTVGIEGPSYGQQRQGGQFARDGLWWRLHARARMYSAEQPVWVVTPAQRAKYATGKGNADKDAVLLDVSRRYPQFTGVTNDEADAFVIAAMLARLDGHPLEHNLPAPHLAALDKLKESA